MMGSAMEERLNLKPKSEMIQKVSVVPRLAPKITPMASNKVSSCALTKLTTITVVALDDWMMEVMKRPVRML